MSARARAFLGIVLLVASIALFAIAMFTALSGDWSTSMYMTLASLVLMTASGLLAASSAAAAFVPVRAFEVKTEITCPSCGLREVRSFQKGDYVFKEVGECPRCGKGRYISSIFREEEARKAKPPQEEL